MTEPDLAALQEMVPLAGTLGIEVIEANPEVVRARLPWAPERCTAGGVMHGGALMALADTCGGIGAYLNLPDGAAGTATIESKTNFLRAVREGSVTAVTRPLHRGRAVIVLESELRDDENRLVAKVIQTQIFHYPRAG
jgi:1,4-dihydroxy-2-naphthoyl-CoA hydrolase